MPIPSKNPFTGFVFNLSEAEFRLLMDAIAMRKNKQNYGAATLEEFAINCGRKPICPDCQSDSVVLDSHSPNGKQRYLCKDCGNRFGLLTNSIFHSTKKDFDTWINYLILMSFNVPLETTESICHISHPTAMLWRKKILSTVDGYQERIKLKGTIWIDETYIFDSSIIHDDDYIRRRGLSKDQLCIVVAIDAFENTYAAVCGHGKPSKTKIYKALRNHIEEGSLIIHDGEKAHNYLIEKLNCRSQVYIADKKSKEYLEHMALINNLCSWLKRYIYRYVGMRKENLQSYLNWFVYVFRVKKADEIWPTIPRILRHLLLNENQYKR